MNKTWDIGNANPSCAVPAYGTYVESKTVLVLAISLGLDIHPV